MILKIVFMQFVNFKKVPWARGKKGEEKNIENNKEWKEEGKEKENRKQQGNVILR